MNAGYMPKNRPTAAENPSPMANDHHGSDTGKPEARCTTNFLSEIGAVRWDGTLHAGPEDRDKAGRKRPRVRLMAGKPREVICHTTHT